MPDHIELNLDQSETVELDVIDEEITLNVIGEVGPRGPQGPPGPAGGGTASGFFRHSQSVPSTQWTFTHDLQYPPAVTVVDPAGNQVFADVTYLDDFNIQIEFGNPTAGSAYCT